MPKGKTHKGLLKRIKISANGKVKFKHARNGHLRSKKTGSKLRKLRQKVVAAGGDVLRVEKMLHIRLDRHARD
jgi:large subunit ribosomal protein L35